MAWIYLLIASVFEVAWAVGLKKTDGLTRPLPTTFTIAAMLGSFWFLALAARHLPIGTAYAAWTGIGVVGAVAFGMILYDEPRTIARFLCIGLILVGVLGLKLTATNT